jgi:5-dehydro-2-deoxygluconokinase
MPGQRHDRSVGGGTVAGTGGALPQATNGASGGLAHAPGELELVTIGRIGVDLYPMQIGVPLAEVTGFAKFLGGTTTNVAVAAARLGRRAAVVTKVGDDGFGEFCLQALRRFGVDTRWVGRHPTLRTPITFCEVHPPDRFPILFYRAPTAPDLTIQSTELPIDEIVRVPIVWTSGTALCEEPSRTTVFHVVEERARRAMVIHDLDYRPQFWRDAAEARRWGRALLQYATVAVGNREEVEVVTGTQDPESAAAALLDLGLDLAVVKMGEKGVFARNRETSVHVAPAPVEVLNGLGAGDGFGGALCHGLLAGWELSDVVTFANAAGAIVASRLACADAMPTVSEITELLERASRA